MFGYSGFRVIGPESGLSTKIFARLDKDRISKIPDTPIPLHRNQRAKISAHRISLVDVPF